MCCILDKMRIFICLRKTKVKLQFLLYHHYNLNSSLQNKILQLFQKNTSNQYIFITKSFEMGCENCCAPRQEKDKHKVSDEIGPLLQSEPSRRPGCMYLYDEKMTLHEDTLNGDQQAERPARISSINDYLKEKGLLEKVVHLQIEHSLVIQEDPGGQACYPEIEQKHTRGYINLVRTKSERL